MNLVFIDALFRHLLWTGDRSYARKVWPVIVRHLAWEQRLFRRTYGPEQLPLYEAYAAIWASDNLQYGGGGAAHASAYNYYENRMAAKLAPLVRADPAPYAREAGPDRPRDAGTPVDARQGRICRIQGLARPAAPPPQHRIVVVLPCGGFGNADAGGGLADDFRGRPGNAASAGHGVPGCLPVCTPWPKATGCRTRGRSTTS